MTGIIIFSALLSTITTTGLYTLFSGPAAAPKHRKGQ